MKKETKIKGENIDRLQRTGKKRILAVKILKIEKRKSCSLKDNLGRGEMDFDNHDGFFFSDQQ